MSGYFLYNGDPVLTGSKIFGTENRAFLYGDGLFETMRACGGQVNFFTLHFQRMITGMKRLKMHIPVSFNPSLLQRKISKMLIMNKISKSARIRWTVFRNPGGYYSPETGTVSYILESSRLENDRYILNEKGLRIDVCNEIKTEKSSLSGIKSASALQYVLAGIFKTEKKLDEAILLNQKGLIAEGISSNLFFVRKNGLFTPSLDEGCIDGIMRKIIIGIATEKKIPLVSDQALVPEDLLTMDEIWLTNAVQGIRWAVAYQDKRYYNTLARKMAGWVNEKAMLA